MVSGKDIILYRKIRLDGRIRGSAVGWFSTAQAAGQAMPGPVSAVDGRAASALRGSIYARTVMAENSDNATAVIDRKSPIAHAPTGGGQQSPAAQLELKGELSCRGIEVTGYLLMKCFGARP